MPFVLDCSVRAVLVAAAVAVVVKALRIVDARARHLAWCGVLAAMLLLPVSIAWGPKARVRVLPAVAEPAVEATVVPVDTGDAGPFVAAPASGWPAGMPAPAHERPDLLLMGYLAIAGISLMRLLVGVSRAASLRRRAGREGEFFSSRECVCPVTAGWWRPVVVLPAGWTGWPRAELEAVLAHEREHVRRRDPLVQALAALNRCIFWFHPLAWWLEHRLSALAEEACDAAVIGNGHDPRDYSEYLIHQARAVERAGTRIALSGAAMAGGNLSKRIDLLLEARPRPVPSRWRGIAAAACCVIATIAFTACRIGRVEKAAPGQPTMNELMHRRADENRKQMDRQQAILSRAHTLTADEAAQLFATLRQRPQDMDSCFTLIRYYEYRVDVQGLDALTLWYIEHQPTAQCGGNIDPRADRAGYEKGKALWQAHLKQPGATAEIYERAANFLEGEDKPLAESVLDAGRKAYPGDRRWPMAFGRHYAQVLVGAEGPLSQYNMVRNVSSEEAGLAYAGKVRAQLAESRDAGVLAETGRWLVIWGNRHGQTDEATLKLARTYVDRAFSIDPELGMTRSAMRFVTDVEDGARARQLMKEPPAVLAAAPPHDRMLAALYHLQQAAYRGDLDASRSNARALLDLAKQNRGDALYAAAVFGANIQLGKVALRHGDRTAAVRYLLAAADAPPSEALRRGEFAMNLPRALVDWGERGAVIEFFRRMAPKTARANEFRQWADELAKGINPDLIPTLSVPGCTNDPC